MVLCPSPGLAQRGALVSHLIVRDNVNSLPTLNPGDVVDVVAPASACSPCDLQQGLRLLEEWGLRPRIPWDLFGRPYLYAHDDAVRWRHLKEALGSRDSKAIWCVRGGYGSMRILPYLQRLKKPRQPKLVIGFSDITALQTVLIERWGWPALHAPGIAQIGRNEPSARAIQELRRVLLGTQQTVVFSGLRRLGEHTTPPPCVRARLVGGNLKTLQSMLGTPWQPRSSPYILFFEDVNERAYAVDRMLVQMRAAGMFRKTRAMVLGDFVDGVEPNGKSLWKEVFREFAGTVSFPVLTGMPVGHGRRLRPLPLGLVADLELGKTNRLCVSWTPRGAAAR